VVRADQDIFVTFEFWDSFWKALKTRGSGI
jgi:hypothetical protein